MDTEDRGLADHSNGLRRIRVRYAGKCVVCGADLAKGVDAMYHADTKTLRCVECNPNMVATSSSIDAGSAGDSAHNEFERRRTAREARVKARLGGVLGEIVLAVTDEPQSTRAWERGSAGEHKLAEVLASVEGVIALHDRGVPGTRGNIDHVVVASSGVYVIDAKHYAGLIQIRDRGGLLTSSKRLYVGSRDCSDLAANMGWQTDAVKKVLGSVHDLEPVEVHPVLCFIDGEWPLLLPPESFQGVRLEGGRSIKKLLATPGPIDGPRRERIAALLAIAFPAKRAG